MRQGRIVPKFKTTDKLATLHHKRGKKKKHLAEYKCIHCGEQLYNKNRIEKEKMIVYHCYECGKLTMIRKKK